MNHAQSTDSLVLPVAGRPVGRYVTRPELAPLFARGPHLHPVTTLAGTAVTELSPADHTHHLGVGVAVPDVEGHNFWARRHRPTRDRPSWPTTAPSGTPVSSCATPTASWRSCAGWLRAASCCVSAARSPSPN